MEEFLTVIAMVIPFLLCGALIVLLALRFFKDYLTRGHTVEAVVIDKIHNDYTQNGRTQLWHKSDYILRFSAEGKQLSFRVSVWLHDSVREGEKCIICYKSSRLISIE